MFILIYGLGDGRSGSVGVSDGFGGGRSGIVVANGGRGLGAAFLTS